MTVNYNIAFSTNSLLTFGSIWRMVGFELCIFISLYYCVLAVYRYALTEDLQTEFEKLATALNSRIDKPVLTFLLGFFVTNVIERWKQVLSNISFIEDVALNVATHIRGASQEIRLARRSIIRYVVLTQILVFRDVSMRVRRRFPAMESLVEAGFMLKHELAIYQQVRTEKNNKHYIPTLWANTLIAELYEVFRNQKNTKIMKVQKKVISNPASYVTITNAVNNFRKTTETICKFDWVPIPLAYPQVVFVSVRVYFLMCLISRQFLLGKDNQNPIDFFVPLLTILDFFFIVGWMKVAEDLMNPFGEDDDDFEGNFVIDKNIMTGMTIVDFEYGIHPELQMDIFDEFTVQMYSKNSAMNGIDQPLISSVADVCFDEKDTVMVENTRGTAERPQRMVGSLRRRPFGMRRSVTPGSNETAKSGEGDGVVVLEKVTVSSSLSNPSQTQTNTNSGEEKPLDFGNRKNSSLSTPTATAAQTDTNSGVKKAKEDGSERE